MMITDKENKDKEKISLDEEEKSNNVMGFNNFMNLKDKNKNKNKSSQKPSEKKDRARSASRTKENKSKEKEGNKSIKKNNQTIINDFLKRNAPKKVEIKKDKNNDLSKKVSPRNNIVKKKNINVVKSPNDNNRNNIIDFKSFKKEKKANLTMNNNKSPSMLDKNSSFKRQKENKSIREKSPNYIRNIKKIEDTAVPIGVTEAEINTAVKSINLGQNIPKRFTPIKDELIKYDNSKFAKYDIAQLRYELNKDYSNIHPDKDNGFLQRMQFDSLKRKNKQDKINELVEKNKYKINEEEREKVFNRLMEDAN